MRLFLFLSALLNGAQILHGLQDGAEHRLRAGGFAASALHLLQRWRRQQRPSPGHACSPPEVFQPEAETKKIFGLRRTRIDQVLKKLLVSTFFCFESIAPFFKVLNSHYLNSSYQWEKRPSQRIVFLHLPTNPSKRHFRFLRAPALLLKNLSREISLLVSYFLMKESNLVGAGSSRVSMDQKRYSKVSCYFRFLAS